MGPPSNISQKAPVLQPNCFWSVHIDGNLLTYLQDLAGHSTFCCKKLHTAQLSIPLQLASFLCLCQIVCVGYSNQFHLGISFEHQKHSNTSQLSDAFGWCLSSPHFRQDPEPRASFYVKSSAACPVRSESHTALSSSNALISLCVNHQLTNRCFVWETKTSTAGFFPFLVLRSANLELH